jgi:eukaryotic-like serine/threonine-protein kinase
MADEHLRKLERQTAAGDAETLRRLVREQARQGDHYAQATQEALGLEGFRYQRHGTYSRGQRTNEVALFEHERTGLIFCLVPGGSFLMGSPEDEAESHTCERPQHEVILKAFLICQTPCTQEAWERIAGDTPPKWFTPEEHLEGFPPTAKGLRRPVEHISWEDVHPWLELAGDGLRLPAEAEWEYACRAGATTPFAFGETITTDQVNYDDRDAPDGTSRGEATDVATFSPNAFGLYDVHGNVWEWCQDAWHDDYEGAPTDGSAWEGDPMSDRLGRGGSWSSHARDCRSASRRWSDPADSDYARGFRPSRSL